MDISERLKMLPPDGTMEIVNEKKDYKSNLMIIRCPDELKSPSDPEFHLAIVDRSIVGTNYSGDAILDKLCPELLKVKLPREEEPKTDSSPPTLEKYADERNNFYSTQRGNLFSSRSKARFYRNVQRIERHDESWKERNYKSWKERNYKSWAERNDKFWGERNDKSWTKRNDKSWMKRSMRSNVTEISPWEEGKQPWINPLGNIQVPIFGGNVPMNIDYHVPVPLHPPGVFHSSPQYCKITGLLGHHPYEANTFPSVSRDLEIGNVYRNQTRTWGNDNRNQIKTGCNDKKTINQRGRFQKNNCFKRKPFVNKVPFQNNERNSEASIWNDDEGARLNNKTGRQNRNRQKKSFNRGRPTYRGRTNY